MINQVPLLYDNAHFLTFRNSQKLITDQSNAEQITVGAYMAI